MKRSLICLAVAGLAVFGGSAQADDVVALGTGALSGAATQADESTYSIAATISVTNANDQTTTDYDCQILGVGLFDGDGRLVKAFPNDELTWTAACADGQNGTFAAEFLGSNRPIKRDPVGDTGVALLQFGGAVSFDGDAHGHVATCKGYQQFPKAEFACAIL